MRNFCVDHCVGTFPKFLTSPEYRSVRLQEMYACSCLCAHRAHISCIVVLCLQYFEDLEKNSEPSKWSLGKLFSGPAPAAILPPAGTTITAIRGLHRGMSLSYVVADGTGNRRTSLFSSGPMPATPAEFKPPRLNRPLSMGNLVDFTKPGSRAASPTRAVSPQPTAGSNM